MTGVHVFVSQIRTVLVRSYLVVSFLLCNSWIDGNRARSPDPAVMRKSNELISIRCPRRHANQAQNRARAMSIVVQSRRQSVVGSGQNKREPGSIYNHSSHKYSGLTVMVSSRITNESRAFNWHQQSRQMQRGVRH